MFKFASFSDFNITTRINNADRISQLPDNIIHSILSLLRPIEVVRVSILSKTWYGFFTRFPISDFSETSYGIHYELPFRKEDVKTLRFANFVYISLLRQSQQHRIIPKFQLSLTRATTHTTRCRIFDVIGQCILLAAQYGITELDLKFPSGYELPQAIISAKELVVCRLACCYLKLPLEASLYWPSLVEFSLTKVFINDQAFIDNLNLTCPFIEKFTLDSCAGLKYVRLAGFTKLKKVKIREILRGRPVWDKIEIEALSLQTFSYSGGGNQATPIDLTPCENVEVLKIKDCNIGDNIVQDLISKLPALKVLVLHGFDIQRIEILSHRLEKLEIFSTDHMVDRININAPRLQSFKYILGRIPSMFSLNQTSLHEVYLKLFLDDIYSHLNGDFLQDLGEFIRNFNHIKHVTMCVSNFANYGIPEMDRNIFGPAVIDITHLKLKIGLSDAHAIAKDEVHKALVDEFFWMCHPKSLSLVYGWGTNDEFLKALCEKLMHRVREKHCSTENLPKCWQHSLEAIKIEHYGTNGDKKVLTICDALLDSLKNLGPNDEILFQFTW